MSVLYNSWRIDQAIFDLIINSLQYEKSKNRHSPVRK